MRALLLLLALVSYAFAEISTTQKNALTALYNSCGGSGNWVNKWTTGNTVCPSGSTLPWYGVVCTNDLSAVLELNLGYNNVVGSGTNCCNAINGLNVLTSVRYIFLANNGLTCPFPSWPSLTALQTIQIQNNQFSGSIPTSISGLTQLTSIIAFNNRITGPLPNFPTSLQKLYLTKNLIASTIPTSVSTLTNLNALFLGNNTIPGPLPDSFSGLTNLLFVDLSFNQIDGSLISLWSPLGSTRPNVNLKANRFDCRLPSTLATIAHVLDLSLNQKPFLCPLPAISPTVTGISSCVEMRLQSVTPTKIPTTVSTQITLTGTNFNQCAGKLQIRIGSSYVTGITIAPSGSLYTLTFTAPSLTIGYKAVQIYFLDGTTPASSNYLGVTYFVPCASGCNNATNPNVAGCDETTGTCICKSGWGGALCNTVYIPCPSNCNNLGTCNTGTGVCTCNPGYTGFDCSTRDINCPNNCYYPHGDCDRTRGTCSCRAPWVGTDCQYQPCPGNCNGHGTCNGTTGICTCDVNWSGSACTTAFLTCPGTPECNGRGTCDHATGLCACTLPWTTATGCQYQNCPNDCSGHGTCNGTTGICTCTTNWAGADCNTPYFPCGGTPMCTGQGTCNYATGTCICTGNYSPISNCSLAPCPGDCSGQGTCNGATATCTCNTGYIGADCSVRNFTCPGSPECFNHGTCNRQTGICNCNLPWTAASNCQYQPCPDDCYSFSSQGTCNQLTGNCTCATGWAGPNCNTPSLSCPGGCANGGTCNTLTGTCICVTPWISSTGCTTRPCPQNCNNHGSCNANTGVCSCDPTYLAPDCVGRNIPCSSPTCNSRGTCDTTTGTCNCTAPWDPLTACATQACPNDCSGRGTCDTNTGVCTCPAEFTGNACQTPVISCGTAVPATVCSGHGTCSPGGQCVCDAVPTGQQPWAPGAPYYCSVRLCPGTCIQGDCNNQTGICECYSFSDRYYTGLLCQTPYVYCDDLNPAHSAQWCNAALDGGYCRTADGQCICRLGYSLSSNCYNCSEGFIRDPDTNKCVPPRTCAATCVSPRGSCSIYTGVCTCSAGFTGANCDQYDCPRGQYCPTTGECYEEICSGHGTCIPLDAESNPPKTKCQCISGWTGPACDKRQSSAGKTALAATLGCVAVVAVAGGGLYAARRHAINNYRKKMGKNTEMK